MECLLQVHDLWSDQDHHSPQPPSSEESLATGLALDSVRKPCVWLEEGLKEDPQLGVALLAAVHGLVDTPTGDLPPHHPIIYPSKETIISHLSPMSPPCLLVVRLCYYIYFALSHVSSPT